MTITTELIDLHLDAILRASGSALRHYSMQKTLDAMRAAMRLAIEAVPFSGLASDVQPVLWYDASAAPHEDHGELEAGTRQIAILGTTKGPWGHNTTALFAAAPPLPAVAPQEQSVTEAARRYLKCVNESPSLRFDLDAATADALTEHDRARRALQKALAAPQQPEAERVAFHNDGNEPDWANYSKAERAQANEIDLPTDNELTIYFGARDFYPENLGDPSRFYEVVRELLSERTPVASKMNDQQPDWEECERISNVAEVDECIRGVLEDQTGDNATCMVRAILAAAGQPMFVRQRRETEIMTVRLRQAHAQYEHVFKVLLSISMLAPSGNDIHLPDGRTMRFNDPNAAETLNALGRAIHAIPAKIADLVAIRKGE